MGDAVADKYEWTCSLAKKAVAAEHNADCFYAAYLYGGGKALCFRSLDRF
jgi:hypothetical protein